MKTLIIFCFALCQLAGLAQSIDYNKIIIPEKVIPSSFKERIVQLAWTNHPSNKSLYKRVELSQTEKKVTQLSWLRDIYAVGNLNEFTINPDPAANSNRTAFFPRYNFSVKISLGTLFLTPLETKGAKYKVTLNELEIDKRKLELRSTVLILIEKLTEMHQILKLKGQLKEDYMIMYKDVEKKFLTGQADIDKYRQTSQIYYQSMEDEIRVEAEFNQHKIAIESLIGVRMEDVEGYDSFLNDITLRFKN